MFPAWVKAAWAAVWARGAASVLRARVHPRVAKVDKAVVCPVWVWEAECLRWAVEGLKQALEWAIAQHADKNSPYYGKLDIDNIAAAGMSCGGLQALHMSADERIKTILVMNSGFFGTGDSEDKASLATMKQKSVIWILGGSTDIAWENGNDDFKRMSGSMPACLVSLDGIGHGGTYMQPNGGDYAKVAGAWLKWWLKGDKEASTMFTGSEPGVSKMANWSIERKNIK